MDAADPREAIEDTAAWEAPPRRRADPAAAPVLSVDGFRGTARLAGRAGANPPHRPREGLDRGTDKFVRGGDAGALAPQVAAPTLARWADWLVLAADLTMLRSRQLLPADATARRAAEAEAETLRRRLLDRAAITAAAGWLERQPQLGRDVFARGASDEARATKRGRAGDITALLRACLVALALPEDRGAAYRLPAKPFWTAADAVLRIRRLLAGLGQARCGLGAFLPAIPASAPDRDLRCRAALASTFVGGLELARDGVIALRQERAFGQTLVARREI